MKPEVLLYDTTLRDGTQGEGISFSVDDKLKIAKKLDDLGIDYIEGGWPGSNPKDMDFFLKVQELKLKNATITAFGSTRRAGIRATDDQNLQMLVESGVKVVAIFGKTWDFQVREALKTTLDENLNMIDDSVRFLKNSGLEVIFDAEHFFDGYKNNREYALATVKKAQAAGADCVTLCDTNGGTLPHEIFDIVTDVVSTLSVNVGIHCHNDCELAVANSLAAVRAGARHVQGTINGYGERCGNANLISIIPNLQMKLGYSCVAETELQNLNTVSKYVHEIANQVPPNNQPFVGKSAFAHKGGMHVSAILKHPETYEHITPESIGNERRVLVSELSGQSNLLFKAKEWNLDLDKQNPNSRAILDTIKEKEHQGYQYEAAEASFELMVRDGFGQLTEYFQFEHFKIFIERDATESLYTEAVVKLRVNGEVVHTVSEGNGPVNALDNALRKALEQYFPLINNMYLSDYKVRVLDETDATASIVRVLIESSDGKEKWSTIGVSANIVEASWYALIDSVRYYLMKHEADIEMRSSKKQEQRIGVLNH